MSSLGIDLNNNGWTTDSGLPSDPPSVSTIPLSEPELNDEARAFSVWIQQHVADAIETATTPLRVEIDALRNRLAALESSPHAPPAFSTSSRAPSFKVNSPPEFDGSRENGEGFLNACRLYLQLRPDDFPDVSARIGWILSYMTSGRARTWRDTAITHRAMYGGYSWLSEKSFFEAFESEFFPVAESEAALIKLESNGYYQRPSESVDLYVDRFRELVKKANLGNNPSVVVKFRRGLSEQLHRLLSDQPEPPSSLDVEDWIRRSRGLEHSRQVQRTIAGGVRSHPTPPRDLASRMATPPAPPPAPRSFFSRPAPFVPGLPANPASPAGVPKYTPMELDAMRK